MVMSSETRQPYLEQHSWILGQSFHSIWCTRPVEQEKGSYVRFSRRHLLDQAWGRQVVSLSAKPYMNWVTSGKPVLKEGPRAFKSLLRFSSWSDG